MFAASATSSWIERGGLFMLCLNFMLLLFRSRSCKKFFLGFCDLELIWDIGGLICFGASFLFRCGILLARACWDWRLQHCTFLISFPRRLTRVMVRGGCYEHLPMRLLGHHLLIILFGICIRMFRVVRSILCLFSWFNTILPSLIFSLISVEAVVWVFWLWRSIWSPWMDWSSTILLLWRIGFFLFIIVIVIVLRSSKWCVFWIPWVLLTDWLSIPWFYIISALVCSTSLIRLLLPWFLFLIVSRVLLSLSRAWFMIMTLRWCRVIFFLVSIVVIMIFIVVCFFPISITILLTLIPTSLLCWLAISWGFPSRIVRGLRIVLIASLAWFVSTSCLMVWGLVVLFVALFSTHLRFALIIWYLIIV